MKTYKLPEFGIEVEVEGKTGELSGGFRKDTCPCCNAPYCNRSCDESQGEYGDIDYETDDDVEIRLRCNQGLDVLEALILAHACEGVDVSASAYREGIQTVLDTLSNI